MEDHSNNAYSISRFNLLTSLLAVLNKNDESDTDFVIARYFLSHLDKIDGMSIYQLADSCYVSRSSVQRFIKNIGYESYTQVKQNLREVIVHEGALLDYTDHAGYANFITSEINRMTMDISQTAQSGNFRKLVNMFMSARNAVILTAEDSSPACKLFQQQILATGKLIRIISSANSNLSLLDSLKREDLLLVCSVTGNFALAVNSQIKEIKATKCLITLNKTSVFEDVYDFIYYMGETPKISTRNIISSKNVYTNYGLFFFFDLFFHDCFREYEKTLGSK